MPTLESTLERPALDLDLDSTPVLIAPTIEACESIPCTTTPCSAYTHACTYASCPDIC
jgi:hypothetical protein